MLGRRIKPEFQYWKERAKIPIFERLRPELKSYDTNVWNNKS